MEHPSETIIINFTEIKVYFYKIILVVFVISCSLSRTLERILTTFDSCNIIQLYIFSCKKRCYKSNLQRIPFCFIIGKKVHNAIKVQYVKNHQFRSDIKWQVSSYFHSGFSRPYRGALSLLGQFSNPFWQLTLT